MCVLGGVGGRAAAAGREPEANCSVTVVDPVLKPIVYPDTTQALAVPAAAAVGAQVPPARRAAPPRAPAPVAGGCDPALLSGSIPSLRLLRCSVRAWL